MKRINIQKDVESRKKMEENIPVPNKTETTVETVVEPVMPPTDAQSQDVQEHEADQSPEQEGKPKKRRREAKGNV